MKTKVSIIIPVYKVEDYLERCVNSALTQTLEDIEIILVDDGSPDKCPMLCDNYLRLDSRIKVIHKSNGGLASARNAGMRMATGKYIMFLDSDDWITPNAAEELYLLAEEEKVDFVRFRPMYAGWPMYKDGTLCDFGTERGMTEGLYSKEDIIKTIYPRLFATPQLTLGVIVAAWRSFYLKSFIEQNNLYFDEQVKYSEDTIFSAKVVKATTSFYYLDGPRYYYYYYNPSSITKSFRSDRWDSYKKLVDCFENKFSDDIEFDFTKQLWLQKIYCVLSALGQRRYIEDIKKREEYCYDICHDEITVKSFEHLDLVRVPWKLYIILQLIRLKKSKILARI